VFLNSYSLKLKLKIVGWGKQATWILLVIGEKKQREKLQMKPQLIQLQQHIFSAKNKLNFLISYMMSLCIRDSKVQL